METDFLCTQAIADDLDDTFVDEDDNDDEEKKQVATLKVLPNQKLRIPAIEFPIFAGENIVGRHTSCGISIPWSLALSKKHAIIEAESGSCFILDCGSSNLTRLGKVKLKPNIRYSLRSGDNLVFGDVRCTFQQDTDDLINNDEEPTTSTNVQTSGTTPKVGRHVLASDTPDNHQTTSTFVHSKLNESTSTIPESQPITSNTLASAKLKKDRITGLTSALSPLPFELDESVVGNKDAQLDEPKIDAVQLKQNGTNVFDVSHVTESDADTDYHMDSDTDIEDNTADGSKPNGKKVYEGDTIELATSGASSQVTVIQENQNAEIGEVDSESEDEEEISLIADLCMEQTQRFGAVKYLGESTPVVEEEKPGCSKIQDLCDDVEDVDSFGNLCTQGFGDPGVADSPEVEDTLGMLETQRFSNVDENEEPDSVFFEMATQAFPGCLKSPDENVDIPEIGNMPDVGDSTPQLDETGTECSVEDETLPVCEVDDSKPLPSSSSKFPTPSAEENSGFSANPREVDPGTSTDDTEPFEDATDILEDHSSIIQDPDSGTPILVRSREAVVDVDKILINDSHDLGEAVDAVSLRSGESTTVVAESSSEHGGKHSESIDDEDAGNVQEQPRESSMSGETGCTDLTENHTENPQDDEENVREEPGDSSIHEKNRITGLMENHTENCNDDGGNVEEEPRESSIPEGVEESTENHAGNSNEDVASSPENTEKSFLASKELDDTGSKEEEESAGETTKTFSSEAEAQHTNSCITSPDSLPSDEHLAPPTSQTDSESTQFYYLERTIQDESVEDPSSSRDSNNNPTPGDEKPPQFDLENQKMSSDTDASKDLTPHPTSERSDVENSGILRPEFSTKSEDLDENHQEKITLRISDVDSMDENFGEVITTASKKKVDGLSNEGPSENIYTLENDIMPTQAYIQTAENSGRETAVSSTIVSASSNKCSVDISENCDTNNSEPQKSHGGEYVKIHPKMWKNRIENTVSPKDANINLDKTESTDSGNLEPECTQAYVLKADEHFFENYNDVKTRYNQPREQRPVRFPRKNYASLAKGSPSEKDGTNRRSFRSTEDKESPAPSTRRNKESEDSSLCVSKDPTSSSKIGLKKSKRVKPDESASNKNVDSQLNSTRMSEDPASSTSKTTKCSLRKSKRGKAEESGVDENGDSHIDKDEGSSERMSKDPAFSSASKMTKSGLKKSKRGKAEKSVKTEESKMDSQEDSSMRLSKDLALSATSKTTKTGLRKSKRAKAAECETNKNRNHGKDSTDVDASSTNENLNSKMTKISARKSKRISKDVASSSVEDSILDPISGSASMSSRKRTSGESSSASGRRESASSKIVENLGELLSKSQKQVEHDESKDEDSFNVTKIIEKRTTRRKKTVQESGDSQPPVSSSRNNRKTRSGNENDVDKDQNIPTTSSVDNMLENEENEAGLKIKNTKKSATKSISKTVQETAEIRSTDLNVPTTSQSKTRRKRRNDSLSSTTSTTSSTKELSTPAKKVKSDESNTSSLATVPRTLRKKREKPRVMFTGILDGVAEGIVTNLGGKLVSDITECTHLVTDKMRRTIKFLCAVTRGLRIVTLQWLHQSAQQFRFLPEEDFQLCDDLQSPNGESLQEKYNFSLQRTLQLARASPDRLLHGYTVFVMKNVAPTPKQMNQILESAGARVLSKFPTTENELTDKTIIIATANDKKTCTSAINAGCKIVTNEFVLTGILRHEVDFEPYALFNSITSGKGDKNEQTAVETAPPTFENPTSSKRQPRRSRRR